MEGVAMKFFRLCSLTLSIVAASACSSEAKPSGTTASPTIGQSPAGKDRPKVWLSAVRTAEGATVSINYEQGAGPAPRIADLRLAYSEGLEVGPVTVGASASTAGKELTVQEPQPNLVRMVLLSRDTRELKSGELLQLAIKKRGAAAAKLDLLMDKPMFAPAEAMQGLLIGDPIQL